ncbi:MAG: class I SAM-dependent methyltransferase, partial [Deltaproteobacteria bacterium]|nr:class I SAM-dependent methyltransferase [Deltaproteobacteria bacterium]
MTPSACPLCGTLAATNLREVSDHDTGETFLIVRCTNCDHQFLSPAPRVEELERYYQSELTGGAMRRPPSDFVRGLQRIGLRRETALLRTLVQPHGGIVDLGAGDGALVQMLAESGYRAGACDFYPQEQWPGGSLPYAQVDLHGGRLTVADIHRPLGGAPAAVILRHVLEHLHEPQKVLSTIAESGARFIQITVPNAASPMARWFGSNWYYWDPPRHLQFFTPQTLRAACESSGFRLRASGTAGLDEVVTSLHR